MYFNFSKKENCINQFNLIEYCEFNSVQILKSFKILVVKRGYKIPSE